MSKNWERAWTTQEIVNNASSWSLAGDAGLLKHLESFSENLLSKASETDANLNNLVDNLNSTSIKLDLVKNEFLSLQNTQFIESRVYEEDETLAITKEAPLVKKITDEERKTLIKNAVLEGIEIIDKYYDKISVPASDSEDETDFTSYILRPKDPYLDRPLPYVIGTDEWHKKWHVGLEESSSESETEKSEEKFSDTDSESNLPITDRRAISSSDSGTDISNRNHKPVATSSFNDTLASTDSEEFNNSIPAKAPISNASFAEQLAAKLGNVIVQSVNEDEDPEINKRPIQKATTQTRLMGDLLANEPPPIDDDEIFGAKHTQGMFSGGGGLFDDVAEEGESFWGQKPPEITKQISNEEKKKIPNLFDDEEDDIFSASASNKIEPKKVSVSKGGLFDGDDSDDDIFAKVNAPANKSSFLKPLVKDPPFIADEPPEINAEIKKKKLPGAVSILGEIDFNQSKISSILKKRRPSSSSSENDEVEPKKEIVNKVISDDKKVKKISLFDDADDLFKDDLFSDVGVNKFSSNLFGDTAGDKKMGLFDDANAKNDNGANILKKDDGAKTFSSNLFEDMGSDNKIGLFDDDPKENSSTNNKKGDDVKISSKNVNKEKLFDSDEDIFNSLMPPVLQEVPKAETKSVKKKINLFDEVSSDDDLFSSKHFAKDNTEITHPSSKSNLFLENEPEIKISETTGQASSILTKEQNPESKILKLEENLGRKKVTEDKHLESAKLNEEDNVELSQEQNVESKKLNEEKIVESKKLNEEENQESIKINEDKDVDSKNLKEAKNLESKQIEEEKMLQTSGKINEEKIPAFSLFDDTPPPDVDDWETKSEHNLFDDDDIFDSEPIPVSKKASLFDDEPPALDNVVVTPKNLFEPASRSFFDEPPTLFESEVLSSKLNDDNNTFLRDDVSPSGDFNDNFKVGSKIIPSLFDDNLSDGDDIFADANLKGSSKFAEAKNHPPIGQKDEIINDFRGINHNNPPPERDVSPAIPNVQKNPLKKELPGKLKHNLNINVGALLPGASLPKKQVPPQKSQSFDNSKPETKDKEDLPHAQSFKDVRTVTKTMEGEETIETLHSVTKSRARIPIKRKPSTRRARQAMMKKSEEQDDVDDESDAENVKESKEKPNRKQFKEGEAQEPKQFKHETQSSLENTKEDETGSSSLETVSSSLEKRKEIETQSLHKQEETKSSLEEINFKTASLFDDYSKTPSLFEDNNEDGINKSEERKKNEVEGKKNEDKVKKNEDKGKKNEDKVKKNEDKMKKNEDKVKKNEDIMNENEGNANKNEEEVNVGKVNKIEENVNTIDEKTNKTEDNACKNNEGAELVVPANMEESKMITEITKEARKSEEKDVANKKMKTEVFDEKIRDISQGLFEDVSVPNIFSSQQSSKGIFDDPDSDNDIFASKPVPKLVTQKDHIAQKGAVQKETVQKANLFGATEPKLKTQNSLFDDDDDEDDLFGGGAKKTHKEESHKHTLFYDDREDVFMPKKIKAKAGALFDDVSDDDDIFATASSSRSAFKNNKSAEKKVLKSKSLLKKSEERNVIDDPLDALQNNVLE